MRINHRSFRTYFLSFLLSFFMGESACERHNIELLCILLAVVFFCESWAIRDVVWYGMGRDGRRKWMYKKNKIE